MTRGVVVPAALASLGALAFAASFLDLGAGRAVFALAACAVLPGFALLLPLRVRGLSPSSAVALALALSPFVLGTLTTLLLYAAFDVGTAARVSLFLSALGLAAEAWRRAGAARESAAPQDRAAGEELPPPADAPPAPRSVGAGTVALAAALTLATLWPVATSERVRASIHGMLHASILYSMADRGVPPENPFFAGEPLRYYWAFHAAAASAGELADVEPTVTFAAGNAAALLAFLLLLARLGVDLFGTRLAGAMALLLGFLCLNPLGALLLRTRAPLKTLDEIAGGEDPVNWLTAMAYGDERLAATFTKFMNVSSFPQSFALLLAAWLLVRRLAERPSLPLFCALALVTGGCIALSPITGAVGGLALGVAAGALLLRRTDRAGAGRVCLALLAALLVAAPLVLVGAGNEGDSSTEPPVRLESDAARLGEKALDLAFTLGPVLLLAVPGMILATRRRGTGARILAASVPVLVACAVLLSFPVKSEYKMVRMAAPLLGVFAAGAVQSLARRGPLVLSLGAAAALVLVVPTNVLAWNVYRRHAEATLPLQGDGTRMVVDPAEYPLAEMYEWIRVHTPEDAVIVVNPWRRMMGLHFAGPHHGEEVPVLARRPVFTDTFYYMTDYEPDFGARNGLVQRLYGGARLTADDYRSLAMLRRPIYLLLRTGDPGFAKAALGVAQERRWDQVHKTGEAALYRLAR